MLFPKGFTGFGHNGLAEVNTGVFKTVCFEAARELQGELLEVDLANVTPNFHSATIRWGYDSQTVSILCNRRYWNVGFSQPFERHSCVNRFVDAPKLADVLERITDWVLLTKSELEAPLNPTILEAMDESDRHTIEMAKHKKWFGPANTVGDVLFNYWD